MRQYSCYALLSWLCILQFCVCCCAPSCQVTLCIVSSLRCYRTGSCTCTLKLTVQTDYFHHFFSPRFPVFGICSLDLPNIIRYAQLWSFTIGAGKSLPSRSMPRHSERSTTRGLQGRDSCLKNCGFVCAVAEGGEERARVSIGAIHERPPHVSEVNMQSIRSTLTAIFDDYA